MKRYINYKTKLFLYFFILFAIFTVSVLSFQYKREKEFKIEQLESNLDLYNDIISKYIKDNDLIKTNINKLNQLVYSLPANALRVTIINNNGKVLFDNDVEDSQRMENHLSRPEIIKSLHHDYGTAIRFSNSVNKDFYYYSKSYEQFYVRVALPYDVKVQDFLKADNLYLYFLILVFIIVIFSLIYISDKLGKSISKLKDFAITADNNTYKASKEITFPKNELGIISNRIISIYNRLSDTKEELSREQEKLTMHFNNSENGIAIFSPSMEKVYSNSRFIQYVNTILIDPIQEIEGIFSEHDFIDLIAFIKHQHAETIIPTILPRYKTTVYKNGRYFTIKSIVFEDNSFEIVILDVTNVEKNRLLKQEMTSNIAHELRTPVTSIRGFLETIIENPDIDDINRRTFIDKSHKQILRLSELISDISIITKTEEAPDKFELEEVNIKNSFNDSLNDLISLTNNKIVNAKTSISNNIIVNGSKILLYLLLRNLIDNSIKYVSGDVNIEFNNYLEDDSYYYFSYSDNGEGVPEEHLNRLFERFYRADSGRTRKTGGTGLGLSIVKNSILFHGGEITVKNKQDRGLEFLFTLKKD